MALEVTQISPSALELHVGGVLGKEDYKRFVPLANERIQTQGKVNLLIKMSDFRGWSPSALWEDLKFDVRHYRDVSRVALVGKKPSQEGLATLSKPFTGAEVKFYLEQDIDAARQWVTEA
ncbi:MAG: STAS/SEC14 domain-containing protein [Candidatus Binatia bacterium]